MQFIANITREKTPPHTIILRKKKLWKQLDPHIPQNIAHLLCFKNSLCLRSYKYPYSAPAPRLRLTQTHRAQTQRTEKPKKNLSLSFPARIRLPSIDRNTTHCQPDAADQGQWAS